MYVLTSMVLRLWALTWSKVSKNWPIATR